MAAAQGKYAPIIRAILKSAWGAIPLSRSPALLLLLPCFAISHGCILSCLTCLFPPTFYSSSVCPPICSFSAPQLRRALPQLSSRFLTLGSMREIGPPPRVQRARRVSLSPFENNFTSDSNSVDKKLIQSLSNFNKKALHRIIKTKCTLNFWVTQKM